MSLNFDQDDDGLVTLTAPLSLPMPSGITNLNIPAGFRSDGQSAPRGLWFITGPPIRSPYMRCWLGHDFLCERASCWAERTVADACLAFWLRKAGASKWKVWGTYLACLTYGRIKFLRRNGW